MFDKFPEIVFEGRRLIWDSRQVPNSQGEWVFIPDDSWVNAEIKQKLLSRTNAKFIGGIGTGLDLEVPNPRNLLGEWASLALGEPSRKLKVLGVTGTNGKTTSTAILRALALATGENVCELGTLGLQLWESKNPNFPTEIISTGFTTPEAPQLHFLFSQLIKKNVKVVVMEVSSHASTLGRISGVDFDGMVFTNLTQDHLDFHETLEKYALAKMKLFTDFLPLSNNQSSKIEISKKSKFAILNLGGDIAYPFSAEVQGQIPKSVRVQKFTSGIDFKIINETDLGIEIDIQKQGPLERVGRVQIPLLGAYNAENFFGAYLLASQVFPNLLNFNLQDSVRNFSGVSGRMESVKTGSRVWVDYAHTPDALEKSLRTLVDLKQNKEKIWIVFGCGGDRDRSKRPLMGRVASQLADVIVLTSDNPRSEDPNQIIAEVKNGILNSTSQNFYSEVDRKRAIEYAIKSRAHGDFVLIAGKGHESVQIFADKTIEFSDQKIARDFL